MSQTPNFQSQKSLDPSNPSQSAKLISDAIQSGASNAKIIPISSIVVADWVRWKCKYGCPNYNQYLTCPPLSPSPDETRKVLSNFHWALLLQFVPSNPSFEWNSLHKTTIQIEKSLFFQGYHSVFAFMVGHCPHCKKCNLNKCVHPDLARPSMESTGMDVFSTVRNAGFEIGTLSEKNQQPTYYTLILLN